MRIIPLALVIAFFCLLSTPAARAQVQPASPAEVEKTLNEAKAWLYSKMNANNNWESAQKPDHDNNNKNDSGQWGGQSAIAIYALLASGESHRDPRLVKAIDWLKKADIRGTYAVAFRLLAYTKLPRNEEIRRLAAADLKQILDRMKEQGNAKGMFDYSDSPGNSYSHSRSQYGVLAAWAATELGLEVPTRFWTTVQEAWIRNQDKDGGWTYKHPSDEKKFDTSPGMTAAAVASLFLTYDFTAPAPTCTGNPTSVPIEKGLAFLAKNIDLYATTKKYERDFPLPTLYAVERVGLASGLRYLGNTDWFHKGARFLIEIQRNDGSYGGGYGGAISDTSFGILFLSRGRAPIVMQKLEYALNVNNRPVPGPWNLRPRDTHFVTRFVARETERELSWQIAKLSAPVADLQESQILYLAGNKALAFTPEEEEKLKTFVHNGGLILAHADCGDAAFTQSVQKLGTKWFGAEFREISSDSPIYTRQMYSPKDWKPMPRVLGLSNGVRELMVLIPQNDFGRSWAMNAKAGERAAHFQFLANLFLYANDKSRTRVKGETYLLTKDPKAKTTQKATLARLEYAGNFDPEPAALPRLATHLHNTHSIDATVTTIKLGTGAIGKESVAFLTGTTRVQFNDAERADLKKYITGGGTLVIDAAGGREAFAAAMLAELQQIFPDDVGRLNTLAAESKVFTISKLPPVDYRDAVRATGANTKTSRLRAIEFQGKPRIFLSSEDLTHGLLGAPVDGIIGYSSDYSLALVSNIVQNALAK